VPLDEIVFEQQCLGCCTGNRHLDFPNHAHHRCRFGVRELFAKLAGNAFFQVLRFADVDHLAFAIQHSVSARTRRQSAQETFAIESGFFAHSQRREICTEVYSPRPIRA
jgi:hypothetical protein